MRVVALVIFLFFLFGCEEELRDLPQADQESYITVDASFSNLLQYQRVYLTQSSPYVTHDTSPEPISDAEVDVSDSLSNFKIRFFEIEKGIYQSEEKIGGEVGKSYRLNIKLKDGKEYRSNYQRILPLPKMQNIKNEFTVKTNYPENNPQRVGFDVTVDFSDSAISGQYYQWDWKHYERAMYCATCNNGFDYSEFACSRTEANLPYYEINNTMRPINYRCSNNCFEIYRPQQFIIFSDNMLNGQKINDFPITRVPYDGATDYYFEIEMRSIHPAIFHYYSHLQQTSQSNGSLFDVPAITPFSPNITCVCNPKEKVLGVFSVFGADKELIYIKRNNLPPDVRPFFKTYLGREALAPPGSSMFPTVPCKESKYRSTQEPENWHD